MGRASFDDDVTGHGLLLPHYVNYKVHPPHHHHHLPSGLSCTDAMQEFSPVNESPKEQLILACGPPRALLDDVSQYPDERPVTHRLLARTVGRPRSAGPLDHRENQVLEAASRALSSFVD